MGCITWWCEVYPDRAPHLDCLWSHGQVSAVEQPQIPQHRSSLLWQLICTWALAFSRISDGDVKDHQQLSTAQKPASEGEWSEAGKGQHEAENRNKEKVLLTGMLNISA